MKRVIFLFHPWLWLLIFFNQPHKEERFLAPIYPSLLLVAAVTLDDFLRLICNQTPAVDAERSIEKEDETEPKREKNFAGLARQKFSEGDLFPLSHPSLTTRIETWYLNFSLLYRYLEDGLFVPYCPCGCSVPCFEHIEKCGSR